MVSLKGFDAPIAVTLYNLSCQQVLHQTTSEVLDVRSLGRGLYLMRILHRGQTIARKLVIE
ncbi:MAG: T9SS type A sorting domain-containing protein [Flavobacteriaceae bacterium]